MKCKFCGARLTGTAQTCPACGKKNASAQPPAEYSEMKRNAIVYGSIAAIAAVAVLLFVLLQTGWDAGSLFSWAKPKANTVYCKGSYTVSNWKAASRQDQVIATMGDLQLTNGQLQVYYWMQVRQFIDSYGDSASYLGMDYTGDLAEQTYTDGVSTWQQFFLTSALELWQSNQAFAALAEKENFTLPSSYQTYLNNLEQELEEAARENGYTSAEKMVRAEMGAGCSVADYMDYLKTYYTGYLYFQHLYGQIQPAEEEISAYFEEKAEEFAAAGITGQSGSYVDVRHILLAVHADTDAAWEACREEAEAVLRLWEASNMTEADFVILATDYSDDTGSAAMGGLLTDLARGDTESGFENWCFAPERRPGDYELIKTSYGYHIVYFVETEQIWHAEARLALTQALGRELVEDVLRQYVLEVDYKKIVLGKVKITG